ncbi:MAG: L,D-transpeptidase family protein [Sphingomonas sp.]|nr:L,D-transpeptidase family protein [Sphingomonas sp.]
MSIYRLKTTVFASAVALAAPGAAFAADQATAPLAATQAISLPSAGSVAAIYNQYKMKPIWFRNGAPTVAATQLVQILRRAPLDGLGSGPQMADQIEAAVRSTNGNPAAIDAAEQLMSSSWVLYVQTIKRPTPGMIYQYDVLKPQGGRTDQVLLAAASAPSLEAHISSVAAVNPVYAKIRDAEWARMQSTGSLTPDPRILLNLERARSIPARGRFVLVDAGGSRLYLYENGQPVDSMKVIVGMPDRPTPMISSVMYYIVYNPYWNAPDHLVRGPIAAKTLAGGMKYFRTKMGYQVMADWTANSATVPAESINWKDVASGKTRLRIRQDPGPENFMGVLKFPFPNPEDIYLHDTSTPQHFKDADLHQSNGCVRLEDAKRFGRWLLGGREPVAPGADPEIQVQVQQPVPIILTYLTAQPTASGLTFVKDVYGWDKPGAAQMAAAEMASSRVPRD